MRKNKSKLIKFTCNLVNTTLITSLIAPISYARESKHSNPYLQELENSIEANKTFNSFFQKALDEKKSKVKANGIQINEDRYKAENYLVQIPKLSDNDINSQSNCDLNNSSIISSYTTDEYLPYPMQNRFPDEANKAYCLLQSTFQSLNDNHLKMIEPIKEMSTSLYDSVRESLLKPENDTLVIVVPGIFGEFIDQLGFGEVFGQGLSKMDDPNFKSSFATNFNSYINKIDTGHKLINDERFLLKNLRAYFASNNKNDMYTKINIDEWMKVSSLDDTNGNPIFKIAILGLAPMSLESIKEQKDLAILYINRLNKFMKIYKKLNNDKVPSKIVLVGYSRGTPIAHEMLTILKNGPNSDERTKNPSDEVRKIEEEQEKLITKIYKEANADGSNWAANISAVVSLGGVSLGTSLADESVIFRSAKPDQVRVLQAFKRLMFKLKIIDKKETDDLAKAYEKNNQSGSSHTNWSAHQIVLSTSKEVQDLMKSFTDKVGENIKYINEFLVEAGNLKIVDDANKVNKGVEALSSVSNIYSKLGELSSSLQEGNLMKSISKFTELQTTVKNSPDAQSISNDLMEAGLTLFPKMLDAKSIIESTVPKSDNSLITPSISELIENTFTLRILENYGLNETKASLTNAVSSLNIFNLLNEINFSIRKFQYFFQRTWNGASQLGTLQRLSWLMQNASRLPMDVNYYSISGILNEPTSSYYESGRGFGFSLNGKDEEFLDKSWSDLKNVGNFGPTDKNYDGLDFTFAGSKWNDSQVDWYRTLLWPTMIKAFSNQKSNTSFSFNAKILGILRTHHWGLALPFASAEKTTTNPVTGVNSKDPNNSVENVNPIPRAELLKSIIMSVHYDKFMNQKNKLIK